MGQTWFKTNLRIIIFCNSLNARRTNFRSKAIDKTNRVNSLILLPKIQNYSNDYTTQCPSKFKASTLTNYSVTCKTEDQSTDSHHPRNHSINYRATLWITNFKFKLVWTTQGVVWMHPKWWTFHKPMFTTARIIKLWTIIITRTTL